MLLPSVSPTIDKCAALIALKAKKTYARIPPENKRWLDLEDVMQEGLIEAWQAEQRYDPSRKTKFSSYFYRGLDMTYSGRYHLPFRQQKRRSNGVIEIDAPLPNGNAFDLTTSELNPEQIREATSGFMVVCRGLEPSGLVFVLKLLLGGAAISRIQRRDMRVVQGIRTISTQARVAPSVFRLAIGHPQVKAQVLGEMKTLINAQSEPSTENVLECLTCRLRFSLADVRDGNYEVTALTCGPCLKKMQAQDADTTCFGKAKAVVYKNRTATEGYSQEDAECRLHCPDRIACKTYCERGINSMSATKAVIEDDVDFSSVEEIKPGEGPAASEKSGKKIAVVNKKAVKSAKTAGKTAKGKKPAKAKKTAKKAAAKPGKTVKEAASETERKPRATKSTEKVDLKKAKAFIQLDEKGRDLPFKPDSTMRYLLVRALEGGFDEKKMEAEITKEGYNWKFQRAVLLSGKSGDSSLRPYPSTHTWKVEVKDGRIYVHDVKRIAFYHKLARI